jgi:hypothetical protein
MENKCANLVNRSTTTYIQSLPWTFGNPVINSIYILPISALGWEMVVVIMWDGFSLTCSTQTSHTLSHASIHHL